jgi:hypothetical protein
MSKLFKLKEWLSLEDTCKRLSTTLEEEVNVKDLIQLIITGDLSVSWYFQVNCGCLAVKVLKDNVYVLDELNGEEFLSTNIPLRHITDAQQRITEGELFRVFVDNKTHWNDSGIYRDYRVSSPVFHLEGIYNIHIETGDMKNYFENILFETEAPYEFQFFTGVILEDEEGGLYKIVDPYLDEDSKPEDRISNWAQSPYPSPAKPKLSDLVILRSDLEKFEQSFNDEPIEKTQLPIDLDNRILKTQTLTLLLESIQKAVNDYPNWKRKFDREVIQMRDIDEWLNTSITSTTRDAEIVKKIIVEIFNLKKSIN